MYHATVSEDFKKGWIACINALDELPLGVKVNEVEDETEEDIDYIDTDI